ncbi:MAG: glycosyltransferase, partial [Actinomycetota bacterium]|nr:glycosyltransferase [Actinomycetota bacterium]
MHPFWSTVEPILAALRPRAIVTIGIADDEARATLRRFAREHHAVVEWIATEPGAGAGEEAVQAAPRVAAVAEAVLIEVERVGDRLEALLALLDQLSPAVPGGFPPCLLHGGGTKAGDSLAAFTGITSRELGTAPVPNYDELRVVCERDLLEPVLAWAAAARAGSDGAASREAELERELAARQGEINLLEGLLSQREDYLAALEMAVTEQADQLHATWSSAYWRVTAPLRRLVEGFRAARARLRARGTRAGGIEIPLASLEFEEVQADVTRARPARWRRVPEIGMRAPWRLEQVVPSRVVYRLDCPAGATISGQVAVHSRAWAPSRAAVRAQLVVLGSDGETLHRTGAELDPRQRPGASRYASVSAPLPAGECRVVFEAESVEPAVSRATIAWQDVRVVVPPPGAASPVREAPAPTRRARGTEPTISILLPVHDPPQELVRDAIESVRAQTHRRWQLCIADDGSRDPEVIELLRHYAAHDDRIELLRNEVGGGISAGSNAALTLATGEYVALLDHDDELEPDALEQVVAHLRAH